MKTVLHIGCGAAHPDKLHPLFRTAEWREVRLDIDSAVKPDIVASIADMTIVESASVDAVWSSHNLEHLFAHEVPLALGEILRVLKPGGFLLITLPDIQAAARAVADGQLLEPLYQSPAGPVAALDILYGFRPAIARGNHYMAHRTAFTGQTLGQALVNAGFAKAMVTRGKWYDLWAKAIKPGGTETDVGGLDGLVVSGVSAQRVGG